MTDGLTPSEREAQSYWCTYGQKPTPVTRRIQASEFNTKPFVTPIISSWVQPVPSAKLPKLLIGFAAREMEDKWIVYADGLDQHGQATVYNLRSWTGSKMVELKLQVPEDEGDAHIVRIAWESSQERYRYQTEKGAKAMVREVCRRCLNIPWSGGPQAWGV